jgi:hypothetical protein
VFCTHHCPSLDNDKQRTTTTHNKTTNTTTTSTTPTPQTTNHHQKNTGRAAKLKGFELPKAVHLDPVLFSVEAGTMTPKMSLVRPKLQAAYKKEVRWRLRFEGAGVVWGVPWSALQQGGVMYTGLVPLTLPTPKKTTKQIEAMYAELRKAGGN